MTNAKDFFQAFFGSNLNGGFIELECFEGYSNQQFYPSIDEALADLGNFKINGYFGICPRKERLGTKAGVSHVVTLWADLDFGQEGHKGKTKYDTREEALNAIEQFEFKPSIIVSSGHGFQVYWLLNQPEAITDDSKLEQVESILKGVAVAIGGDEKVAEIARVFRIPNTSNEKKDCEPKNVEIIKFEPALKYSLTDFCKFQGETKLESDNHLPDVSFSDGIENVDVETLEISESIKELIKFGNTQGIYPSRSECDQTVITALLSKRYSADVIKSIFSDQNNKIGEKYREERSSKGDAYLKTSIKNALAYIQKNKEVVSRFDSLPAFPMEAFPSTGFLGDYIKYASEVTDAPVQFHIATAVSLLAIVLNRKVFINRGHNKLFPVFWVVVLSESGAYRKSTSQSIGLDLLRSVNHRLIGSNEFTKEALIKDLSGYPVTILCFNEIASLLSQAEAAYNKGLKPILVDLFDTPDYYVRKLKDKTEMSDIREPFLNILGASTTEWFVENVKEEELRSGFLARFIYISAMKKGKSLAFPPPADLKLKKKLVKMLTKLNKKPREVKLSIEARRIYEDWYAQQERKLEKESAKGILAPFYVRLSDYLLKISMLFAINEGVVTIEGSHMNQAITLTDYLTNTLRYYLKHEMAFSTFAKEKNKIRKMILNGGFEGINHSKLLQNSNKPTQTLSIYLDTLIESDEIYEALGPKKGKVYISTQYRKGGNTV